MPIILIVLGVMFIVVGIKNNGPVFIGAFADNFTSNENNGGGTYITWAVAIFVIGALGYWKTARPIAIGFLILVFAAMIFEKSSGTVTAIQKLTAGKL